MPTLTVKDLPSDVHAQLKREAAANYRSLNQEILARLERSLEAEPRQTERDQRWMDEAIASGPATPLRSAELEKIRDAVLKRRSK